MFVSGSDGTGRLRCLRLPDAPVTAGYNPRVWLDKEFTSFSVGSGGMAARLVLAQVVQVRVLVPQLDRPRGGAVQSRTYSEARSVPSSASSWRSGAVPSLMKRVACSRSSERPTVSAAFTAPSSPR